MNSTQTRSLFRRLPILAAAALLSSTPAAAETDRVGSATAAIWCNAGGGSGHADRLSQVTVCQRDPAVPGPAQCPEFVDRVELDFETENRRARGTITVRIDHFDAAGNLLASFEKETEIDERRAHASVDIDVAMRSGEWLEAEIDAPKSARKLVRRQCATGSLAVLE